MIICTLLLTLSGCISSGTVAERDAIRSTELEDRVVGQSYDVARHWILAEGWSPRVTTEDGPDGLEREWLSAGYFSRRGYSEIEMCAGTGLDPCIFNFKRRDRACLRVYTEGEREAAVVVKLERKCP